AHSFHMVLLAAGMVGLGSAVFHPESSRVARMASGGQHGLAQSLFQVGGNAGSAVGPLAAAFGGLPRGRRSGGGGCLAALRGVGVLGRVGGWYRRRRPSAAGTAAVRGPTRAPVPVGQVRVALAVLIVLVFSKYIYLASLTSYYTFYLIHRFGVSV